MPPSVHPLATSIIFGAHFTHVGNPAWRARHCDTANPVFALHRESRIRHRSPRTLRPGKARLHGRHRVLLLARSGHANTHDVITVERVQNRDEIAAHDEHSLPDGENLTRNRTRRWD